MFSLLKEKKENQNRIPCVLWQRKPIIGTVIYISVEKGINKDERETIFETGR